MEITGKLKRRPRTEPWGTSTVSDPDEEPARKMRSSQTENRREVCHENLGRREYQREGGEKQWQRLQRGKKE